MTRPVIALHGNCVVSALHDVLASLPGAADHYELTAYAFALPPPSDEALARAELLITQNTLFGVRLPVPEFVKKLPAGVPTLRMPNVMLTSLWPFSCVDPRDAPDMEHPFGRHSRSQTDSLALDILRKVQDPAARVAAYLATDVRAAVDLGRLHEIQAEQYLRSEEDCDIRVAAHILTTFQKQRLFFAHHHPTPALVLYLLGQIVLHPRFAPFRTGTAASMLAAAAAYLAERRPFHGEEVPIHPEVARFFGLEWWTRDMLYRIEGRDFTFEQWLEFYMTEPLA